MYNILQVYRILCYPILITYIDKLFLGLRLLSPSPPSLLLFPHSLPTPPYSLPLPNSIAFQVCDVILFYPRVSLGI